MDFLQELKEAELVLIGIGEEFNQVKMLRQDHNYNESRNQLEHTEKEWMIPALNKLYDSAALPMLEPLQKLADLIEDKNYFVVSVSTNDAIRQVKWHEKRLVMPCGGTQMKQCINKCEKALTEVTKEDWEKLKKYKEILLKQDDASEKAEIDLGVCPECGQALILNNIYAYNYDENGYLEQWKLYTKWLQGTLNRKLLVLELGVGMQFPSVIRWPFEKVAFFNQKASFWRVNETLYHLSEELKGKGMSISQNAIDWLQNLC